MMASRALQVIRASTSGLSRNCVRPILFDINRIFLRYRVTTDTGAFLPQPEKIPFGFLRALLTVIPGLYLGATISKEAAAFLEENDIFVPDEDDDED